MRLSRVESYCKKQGYQYSVAGGHDCSNAVDVATRIFPTIGGKHTDIIVLHSVNSYLHVRNMITIRSVTYENAFMD